MANKLIFQLANSAAASNDSFPFSRASDFATVQCSGSQLVDLVASLLYVLQQTTLRIGESGGTASRLQLDNGDGSVVAISAPGGSFSQQWVIPSTPGTAGQILATHGPGGGDVLYWTDTAPTVTSVPWASLTGTPPGVATFGNDAGYLTSVNWTDLTGSPPNISIFANNVGYLTSVAWAGLTGSPPAVSTFANDVGYVLPAGLTAPATSYTPTTPGDWSGSPTTVQGAIDRIAAQVAILLGAPIP